MNSIVIFGASGAIGNEFIRQLSELYPGAQIHGVYRENNSDVNANINNHFIDYNNENAIEELANTISADSPIDMVIIAIGVLYYGDIAPEKSLRDLSAQKFQDIFYINTILPALIGKHFLPKLNSNNKSIFAALSARVGSISDNYLGGWYAYRASKAALNMFIKNASIEVARRNKQAVIVGLHPGTVDSKLSKPFQNNVQKDHLFTPEFAVNSLLNVLHNLSHENSGKCYAWDGEEILP